MNVNLKKFTTLVLSGGGPRALAMLGALHYIDEQGGLCNIKDYWGTSSGSLVNLLLLVGYSPFEAFHEMFKINDFTDVKNLDLNSIIENSALCPIESFGDKVRTFIRRKMGPDADPTFFELYQRYNKKLHVIGTNTTTMQGETFDMDKTPFMKVIDAIEISCDLPYIFTKKVYNGNIYVDGGFINNYPINLADNGFDNVLGICIFGDFTTFANDYIGWIYRLVHIPIMELHRDRVKRLSERCLNIEMNVGNVSIIEMSPTKKRKIEIFSAGYKQMRQKLEEISETKSKFVYNENSNFEWD